MKHIHIPTIEELLRPDELINKLPNGNYLFTNIPYQGKVLQEVEFCPKYLVKGAHKNQNDWAKYSAKNKNGWSVADAEILYQCWLRAYAMRNDSKHQTKVQEFRKYMQKKLETKQDISTLSRVHYRSNLDAIVSSLGPIKKETFVEVPEFNMNNSDWCYVVLAPEQPEKDLGKTSPLPYNARPILKALLGKGYAQAGAVFQYFSTPKDGKLKEARIYTPAAKNRNNGWVVALGFDLLDRFCLLNTDFKWPALGVRPA